MGGARVQGQYCVSVPAVSGPISLVKSVPRTDGMGSRIVAIILAFICFIVLATFPGWHEERDDSGSDIEVKPFPSRPVSQAALALIFIASVFVLVSVLWQHTAAVAASTVAQDFGNGSVKSGVGTSAMILGWFGFALFILVTIGLLVMILSIRAFGELVD